MRFYIVMLLLFITETIFSQDIEVKKFVPLDIGQTAVTNFRNDSNGNPCALLIVQTLKEGLEFEGWVIGDVERKDDAYWVFVANGAKHIKIKHADFQTKNVVFGDYGTSSLKGGQTYSLQLADNTKDIVNKVYQLGWNLGDLDVPNSVQTVLKMAATRGDVKAQKAMAQVALEKKTHIDEKLESNNGLHWIEKLLEEGDSTCLDSMPGKLMYLYAIKLKDGLHRGSSRVGVDEEKNIYTSSSLYNLKACLKGYKYAGDNLFVDYPLSKGLTEYSKDVIRICKDSASVNNSMAMRCLGYIYEKGIGEKVNLKEAAKWFSKADEAMASLDSKTNLCRVYGNKEYPIDDESLGFIKKQSEEGLPEALFQMGCMYEEGRNYSTDIDKAIELYKLAKPTIYDLNRHHGAAYHLARIYYERNDMEKAEKLLKDLYDDEFDARYLQAVILYHNNYKVDAYNILSDLSKKGYQKATEFIKEKY